MNRTPAGRPVCECGCGGAIEVREVHRSRGLPRYRHGHHANPLRRAFAELRRTLVGELAAMLGVSENTIRRMEAEGVIPEARRFRVAHLTVRAYSEAELRRILRSAPMERWRAKHPGRWRR